ncbi:MAG TPA: hypothetical protein DEP87_01885 [Candidatus Pacebacteria bacterium]|nr:hypothetical protein [Candidatus Paceibacterota bacterium]
MLPLTFKSSFLWAKTIHRLAMFGSLAAMSLTGITILGMKLRTQLPQIGLSFTIVRELHERMGTLTFLGFGVMALTGIWMYLFPLLPKTK